MMIDEFERFIRTRCTEAMKDDVYCVIKPYVIESLWRYTIYGIPTGGFLQAVLENDLREAFGRADAENGRTLKNILTYVYMKLPINAWGSPAAVDAWINHHQQKRRMPDAYLEETSSDSK